MLNFRKIFEFLFKSFDISGDTKLIEKLELDGVRFLMIVKRHWIYGIIHSWRVLFVLVIAFINSYLLLFGSSDGHTLLGSIIGIFLLLNVFYWTFIIITYLINFYKIVGSKPVITDIYTAIKKSRESDEIFTKFFNQTLFLLILLFGITIFTSFTAISEFIIGGTTNFGVGVINAILLIVQLGLFYSYLLNMINLEMDFNIVIGEKIYFFNQRGVLGDSQNMNANKIKTMNTKYAGLIGSFFNYGEIIILSEGDNGDKTGEMRMAYIGDPTGSVKNIQKVLNNELVTLEKDTNLVFKKIKLEIKINDLNSEENIKKLRDYLKNNEENIKKMFESGSSETQNEVKELYSLIG
ncbi:hypothetical protein H3C61_03195 [Candidatus Gracilibacteria bacterium]|nr:hypothetical protein [Candidatus Gracilibacteria bacterium]